MRTRKLRGAVVRKSQNRSSTRRRGGAASKLGSATRRRDRSRRSPATHAAGIATPPNREADRPDRGRARARRRGRQSCLLHETAGRLQTAGRAGIPK
eukprot:4754850-Prymnesium_polylepis.1